MVMIKIEKDLQEIPVSTQNTAIKKRNNHSKVISMSDYQLNPETQVIHGTNDDSIASRICYRLSFLKSIR